MMYSLRPCDCIDWCYAPDCLCEGDEQWTPKLLGGAN